MNNYNQIIKEELQTIEDRWKKAKAMLLSEDDLKCHLFSSLERRQDFYKISPTMNDEIYATKLHAEIKFLDENGNLRIKPDITILNPKYLDIENSIPTIRLDGEKIPSEKGFTFGGQAFVIELAFNKHDKGITEKKFVNKVKKDLEKIKKLQSLYSNQIQGSVIVFSKVNHKRDDFTILEQEIKNEENIEYFYGTCEF